MRIPNDELLTDSLRFGAYVCLRVPRAQPSAVAGSALPALADRLGLRNEFNARDGHPSEAVAYLRRVDATPADIADDAVLRADAVIHVASQTAAPVAEFCKEAVRLLGSSAGLAVLSGVVRAMKYTGNAMQNFAYAHQVLQQPGPAMPNAFLVPMSKTATWWAKDWMERHTYLLPRYDQDGKMVSQGHALAAAAGIPHLMRRTYKNVMEPAPDSAYDFLTYFECADANIRTFHEVCASLRDVTQNPEWKYVREGPTWHGRRVETWPELFE